MTGPRVFCSIRKTHFISIVASLRTSLLCSFACTRTPVAELGCIRLCLREAPWFASCFRCLGSGTAHLLCCVRVRCCTTPGSRRHDPLACHVRDAARGLQGDAADREPWQPRSHPRFGKTHRIRRQCPHHRACRCRDCRKTVQTVVLSQLTGRAKSMLDVLEILGVTAPAGLERICNLLDYSSRNSLKKGSMMRYSIGSSPSAAWPCCGSLVHACSAVPV